VLLHMAGQQRIIFNRKSPRGGTVTPEHEKITEANENNSTY
jgi:hypothetical protein